MERELVEGSQAIFQNQIQNFNILIKSLQRERERENSEEGSQAIVQRERT